MNDFELTVSDLYLPTSRTPFAHLGDTPLGQAMLASSKIPNNATV